MMDAWLFVVPTLGFVLGMYVLGTGIRFGLDSLGSSLREGLSDLALSRRADRHIVPRPEDADG